MRFIYCLIFCLIFSSWGYAVKRYNKRFIAFKYLLGKSTEELAPWKNKEIKVLKIPALTGIRVPIDQAEEFEAIHFVVKTLCKPNQEIFTFPEIGFYNAFIERRFFEKYPYPTFAWIKDEWFDSFMESFQQNKPAYVILQKELSEDWKLTYFHLDSNRKKYNTIMAFIAENYQIKAETPQSKLYIVKDFE